MKKYLLLMLLIFTFPSSAQRNPGKCACLTKKICDTANSLKEFFLRCTKQDSSSFTAIKEILEYEPARIDLALAIILFDSHKIDVFKVSMLADLGNFNTFLLSPRDFIALKDTLTNVKDLSYIGEIYEHLSCLSTFDLERIVNDLRLREPILHRTSRHKSFNKEKLQRFESCLLPILSVIAERD